MNLTGITYYGSQFPFADALKCSTPWRDVGDRNRTSSLRTDENGWPLPQSGKTPKTLALSKHYPAGIYVLTYKGTGKVGIHGGGASVVSSSQGRMEIRVSDSRSSYVELRITQSDPNDRVRDMHLWMPGLENAANYFNPDYVATLKPFGTLRFMNFMGTNGSKVVSWDDRPLPTDATFVRNLTSAGLAFDGRGVPLEYMIELCNTLGANPWFCMPHVADDGYVRSFAGMVKRDLNPGLKIYVEYSNEVHNADFAVHRYAAQQGLALGLATTEALARGRFHALRSKQMFTIWHEVFGAEKECVVRVFAGPADNRSQMSLSYEDTKEHLEVFAINTYFGVKVLNNLPRPLTGVSADQVLDELATEIDGRLSSKISIARSMADKYGLELGAYEGGQHLSFYASPADELTPEDKDAFTRLIAQCNRHERMGDLYTGVFDAWFGGGGGLTALFSHISPCGGGYCWGMLESQNQPVSQSPKAQAILEYIDKDALPGGTRSRPRPPTRIRGSTTRPRFKRVFGLNGAIMQPDGNRGIPAGVVVAGRRRGETPALRIGR